MKKILFAILTVLFLAILSLVIILPWENDNGLGENYFYLPEFDAIDVGYPGGAIIYKSESELLFSDVKITGNVIEVKFDDNYIIALQKPMKNKRDLIIKPLNYFLIKKENDRVFGPYNKNEYLIKRKELNIPTSLKLDLEE